MPTTKINPAMVRQRAKWSYDTVLSRLDHDERRILYGMITREFLPRPKYATWTEDQVVARCRNEVAEYRRRQRSERAW